MVLVESLVAEKTVVYCMRPSQHQHNCNMWCSWLVGLPLCSDLLEVVAVVVVVVVGREAVGVVRYGQHTVLGQ